jgi:hypothetical protein
VIGVEICESRSGRWVSNGGKGRVWVEKGEKVTLLSEREGGELMEKRGFGNRKIDGARRGVRWLGARLMIEDDAWGSVHWEMRMPIAFRVPAMFELCRRRPYVIILEEAG